MSSKNVLSSRFTIGFLGAGQLARMSAYEALRFGMRVASYSGSESGNEPLEMMTPFRFPGSFQDADALVHFARQCDIVTLENEFLDAELLDDVEQQSGTPLLPSPGTFHLIGTKWQEKETFRKAGLPVAPYRRMTSEADLERFGNEHGYPFLLKSSKGGYDGYGTATIGTLAEAGQAFRDLGGGAGRELIAEAYVPFVKELAVQVARNKSGTVVYPCCETIQKGHICQTVIAPAPVDPDIRRQACDLAVAATEAIRGTGLFAFELFLTGDGSLLLNESAPRPHNSGHYTMEACVTSQFENHIRTVTGLPPGPADMRRPCAVMENLLGSRNGPAFIDDADEVWKHPDVHLHLYGKEQSRKGRKMGHLTVLGADIRQTRELAATIAGRLLI